MAAGIGEDGLPCAFRSLLGSVWENGELLIIPDCPKCAKIYRVSEERIVGGHFSEVGRNIILITAVGNEVEIKKDEALLELHLFVIKNV